ncbi:uncharacterized protein K444DRAFT_718456, partial [Hyaloscypha bicolor E]
CTWTALHLNIPRKDEGFWSKYLRKLKWMTLTMIAPEYTFWVASGQRSVAIKSLIQLRKYDSWDWTTTHAFYAAMGGFVLVDKEAPDARFPISVEEVIQLLEDKQIPPDGVGLLQHLRQEDIEDRSKANSFAKGLACVQFVCLGLQCSARAAQHLPFTLLELVTVAEAIVTIGTYIMWWNKPFDVTSTIELHISSASTLASSICNPSHSIIASHSSPVISNDGRPSQEGVSENPDVLDVLPLDQRAMMTPANRQHQPQSMEEHDIDPGFLAVGFGALHTAAWNFNFPTLVERNLWRISSLILATSLPIYFLCWIFIMASEEKDSPQKPAILRWIAILIGGVYILARIYTLAECLVSLRRQPLRVYETTKWTLYFPHF